MPSKGGIFSSILKSNLIEFAREEKMSRITESGSNVLNIFDEMGKLLALQLTEY